MNETWRFGVGIDLPFLYSGCWRSDVSEFKEDISFVLWVVRAVLCASSTRLQRRQRDIATGSGGEQCGTRGYILKTRVPTLPGDGAEPSVIERSASPTLWISF